MAPLIRSRLAATQVTLVIALLLWWVVSAARQSTKEDRILRIVEDAALGRRAKN